MIHLQAGRCLGYQREQVPVLHTSHWHSAQPPPQPPSNKFVQVLAFMDCDISELFSRQRAFLTSKTSPAFPFHSHRPQPFSSRRAAVEDSPAQPNAASKASESALKPESKLINSGNPVSSSPQVVQTKAVIATRAAKPATSKLLGASAKEKCAAGT